tara:strand:- start:440 stop:976 length:537 start_codon:yes stop_codon:yes gene_type:complete
MNKQKFYTTIILMLMFFSGYAETATTSSYKGIITAIYLQAVIVGALVSIITLGLISINKYDLIDKRIRKQRDVLKRRITFFTVLLLTPLTWIYYTTQLMSNANGMRIMSYNWSPSDAWIGKKLLDAYINGTLYVGLSYIVFFILFAWLFTKFGKYKGYTVLMSNHKILGIISLNKKNK